MKKTFTLIASSLITFFVLVDTASAQASATGVQQGFSTFAGLITAFNNTVVKALATLFISGAVVAFFFGVTQFIWGLRQGQEKAITDGKQFMIWGLVALFVMFSVYGIIKVTQSLVPGLNTTTITIPTIAPSGNASPNETPLETGTSKPIMYTCPDGVTKYYSQSDAKFCPAPSGGTSQPVVYTCPDGVTKYYSQSDAKFCPAYSGGNTSSNENPLGTETSQPTTYTCPDGVTKYYSQSDAKFCPAP